MIVIGSRMLRSLSFIRSLVRGFTESIRINHVFPAEAPIINLLIRKRLALHPIVTLPLNIKYALNNLDKVLFV